MRQLFLLLLYFTCAGRLIAQLPDPRTEPKVPDNDLCGRAIPIEPGIFLTGLSNELASTTAGSIPHTIPGTCIESFENDVWFSFKSQAGIPYYTFTITTNQCNTPAGLQALVIRTPDCSSKNFQYKACSNKETMDTIRLFLHEPEGNVPYLLYIDGFDGCMCNFNLQFEASRTQVLNRMDYLRMKWDYEVPEEADYTPATTDHEYLNNDFTLRWTASHEDDIDFFIIERVDLQFDAGRASILGLVDARTTVSGGNEVYTYTDPIRANGQYCYKIVAVTHSGQRKYSENYCFEGYLIKAFFAGDVSKTDKPGIYSVAYMNNVKKADYNLQVIDENRKVVKSFKLENEPIRNGTITIDMSAFSPGKYYFVMSNGVELFRREFIVTGK